MMTTTNGNTVSVPISETDLSFLERVTVMVAFLHGAGALGTLAGMVFPCGGVNVETPLWLALYAWAGGMLFVRYGMDWFFWFLRFRFLLVVVLSAALASVLWSVNPSLTLQRAIHLIGTTLIGATLVTAYHTLKCSLYLHGHSLSFC